jgi:predicted amidohydrolase
VNKPFKAGVIQFDVECGRIEANLKKIHSYLEILASENVCLAVLPELFSCSFDNENLKEHATKTQNIIEKLSAFAFDHRMAIAGTLPELEGDRIFNTMVFIDTDGKIKGKYRKLHLFRLTGEHLYYTAGNDIVTVDSTLGRIGLMICYDLRFPEIARALFLKGAELIVISAQWPEPRKEHWDALIKARAIENQLFMVCSNRTGNEADLSFPGMSMIADPMGKILAHAGGNDACGFAEIDPATGKNIRTLIPCMTDRRPEVYG